MVGNLDHDAAAPHETRASRRARRAELRGNSELRSLFEAIRW
jgi:hypothetical protein